MYGVGTPRLAAVLYVAAMAVGSGLIDASAGEETGLAESPSGARFFTINEVLAGRGSPRRKAGAPTRIASLDTVRLRGTLRDAVALAYPADPKPGPFGMANFRAPEGPLWVKWRRVVAELLQDEEAISQCRTQPERCSSEPARRISLIVESVRARVGLARLEEVNRSVNGGIHYLSDVAQHGVPDLWSSALATFSSGQGDCEDYAIAKYVILRATGFTTDDLRIMLVRDLAARKAHAVLAARVDGKWLILDSRRAEMREDHEIGYLMPLFALDDRGVSLLAREYADGNARSGIAAHPGQ